MKLTDITMPMHTGMAVYEGDPAFGCEPLTSVSPTETGSANTSLLSLCTHTGTHIDPPLHFLPRGSGVGVDRIDPEILCGPARVIDVSSAGREIGEQALRSAGCGAAKRLLLKTIKSACGQSAFLTLDGAEYLRRETAAVLIGIDGLSIESEESPGYPVHRALLTTDPPIIVLEGLVLRDVEPGEYELLCLPLRIVDGDGGPVRAVLRRLG